MSDQDQAQEGLTNPTPPVEPLSPNPEPDYTAVLREIKDSSGNQKYGSVEAVLASVPHSQQHIQTIENENKEMRERLAQVEAQNSVRDDILKELKKTQQAGTETSEPSTLDVDKLNEAVDQRVNALNEKKLLQARVDDMDRKLIEVHGTKEAAQKAVTLAAQSLGITVDELFRVGVTTSPALVYKALDLDKVIVNPPQSLSSGTTQTQGIPEPEQRKTSETLRKEFFEGKVDPDIQRIQEIRRGMGT